MKACIFWAATAFVASCDGFSILPPHAPARTHKYGNALLLSIGSARAKNPQTEMLLEVIMKSDMGKDETQEAALQIDQMIQNLENEGCGFNESVIDGEWQLVFTRNAKGSPSLQKVFSFQKGFANFDVSKKVFHNIVQVGRLVRVLADVQYEVSCDEPNRLLSTITMAGIRLGPVLVPLPFKGRQGWLDITYLDKDIRISRGNRGGLFLHVRPPPEADSS